MLQTGQTWIFPQPPVLLATGVVGGKKEQESPLREDFDYFFTDNWAGCKTFEQAEACFLEKACDLAISKAGLTPQEIPLFLAGDLMNQITPSTFTARSLARPFLGLFAACATAMEGLALAALLTSLDVAPYALTGASSHTRSAERQFRYPNEYGCQKPACCHHTATAAAAAVVAQKGSGVKIKAATLGVVTDWGVTNPQNMGGAMAPAAVQTIVAHLQDRQVPPDHYDLIVTGDLGKIGQKLALDLLAEQGVQLQREQFQDCGRLLYAPSKQHFAGGSGPGCVASVSFGRLFHQLEKGELKRVLVVATGALLSPNTTKQGDSIPAIAHAIALEGSDQ